MPKIDQLQARQILDSRGVPTLEAEVSLAGGGRGRAAVPAGASTGQQEAQELRDGGEAFAGRGVKRAVQAVQEEIRDGVSGQELDQNNLDARLVELDGTADRSRLGANSLLAVSLAFARAAADEQNRPLYRYISQLSGQSPRMPGALCNVLNGGAHADSGLSFQEFMLVLEPEPDWPAALRRAAEIYTALRESLGGGGYRVSVGDEGGFAPRLASPAAALEYLVSATEAAGYQPGSQVGLAIDAAGNELQHGGGYQVDGQDLDTAGLAELYKKLAGQFPLRFLEDPFAETDQEGFRRLTVELTETVVIGDDLFVTDRERVAEGITADLAGGVIIKPNQVGTLSQALETLAVARESGWVPIVSHRSGETEDTFIAHLAVGTGAPFIKAGAPARGERTAKYNELLRIAESLTYTTPN